VKIAFFGSSLGSACWNGAATYYRGIVRGLSTEGFDVTFYEPDACERQCQRDTADPGWARVVTYANTPEGLDRALEHARGSDVVIKAGGGVFDRELEERVLDRTSHTLAVFWDANAPATLEQLAADPGDPFHELVPQYDVIFTYGGGEPVRRAYFAAGARECIPIYSALDTSTHFRVEPDPRFACDLAFLGNRLPDREAKVDTFFFDAAARLRDKQLILGGGGWDDKPMPSNIRRIGNVSNTDHNAFNSTPTAVLNISGDIMSRFGFSPATRVFQAAGAGACLITDEWEGIELFLEPGREVLVARDGADVAEHMGRLSPAMARRIGAAAHAHVIDAHTYEHRAAQVGAILSGRAVLV
jgi:spore maturation protein CgeB